jgi:hypothetical protein
MKRRQTEPWDYRSKEQYNSSLDAVGVALLGFIVIILILMMVGKCKQPEQPKFKKVVITEYKENYAVNITNDKRKYLDHLINANK